MNDKIENGTIINHSIGCGCNEFFQVVKKTDKTITVKKIRTKIVNRNIKMQTFDYLPHKDNFVPDEKPKVLRIHDDGSIGPTKRMMWWGVWDGTPKKQWSN